MSPRLLPGPCSRPNCPNRSLGHGKCAQHEQERRQQYEATRPSSTERGYDAGWAKVRREHLAAEPYCVDCAAEGKVVLATDVDHVIPKRDGGPNEAWNLRSRCHRHHSAKTRREVNARMKGK